MRLTAIPFLILFSNALSASPLDDYYQNSLLKKQPSPVNLTEHLFSQWIDHDRHELGTFAQHYFLDENYVQGSNAPTFFYLCGEQACNPLALEGIRPLAQKYHARLVALEHRYYGKSQPRPTLSTDDLQFLTYNNVFHDLVTFETDAIQNLHWRGKWIVFGGSYAGILAAYYHSSYPNLTAGAIASSAPVVPLNTFPQFDAYTAKLAGKECTTNVRNALTQIEKATPEELETIKANFGAQSIKDKVDFLGLLADVTGMVIQFGLTDMFCSTLTTDPLNGYAAFTHGLFESLGVDPVQFTPEGAVSTDPTQYESVIGLRQWTYQTCHEFGAWNIANAESSASLRSPLLNVDYYQQVCQRLFGFEKAPDLTQLTKLYYLPLINTASNIHFTNGTNDPWSRMSLIPENQNTTNPHLTYSLIAGGTHTSDLLPQTPDDSVALQAARAKTDELIKQWL